MKQGATDVGEIMIETEAEQRQRQIEEIDAKKTKLDFRKIPLDDKATWDLIGTGYTKGIFQLEGNLGKRYAREIKPRNMNELSDLISLIRPGCLEAEFREKDNEPGKFSSITHTYIKVKNGEWKPEYPDECLEPIFRNTYSVPVYQEQAMSICSEFAGFNLKEADFARKIIGKKKPEQLGELKEKFILGAANNCKSKELAEFVFGWLEKFSGYLFNKSHGISYAVIAYRTAYAKANYPLQFFKAMLANSDSKQDSLEEIQELVHESRLFGIDIRPPCLKNLNSDFDILDNKSIAFGLGHIKGVGASSLRSLKRISDSKDDIDFLRKAFAEETKVNKGVVVALIKSGALDYISSRRVRLLWWYKLFCELTERERNFMYEQLDIVGATLNKSLENLLESSVPNKARKPKIKLVIDDITRELGGTPKKMCIAWEKFYLGIPLSGSLVDLYYNPRVNIQLKNFGRLSDKTSGCIGVVIESIKKIKDKNHNEMCFLTVSDATYMTDSIVVFSSTYRNLGWIIEEGKPVLITGRKDRDSFLVRKIEHL